MSDSSVCSPFNSIISELFTIDGAGDDFDFFDALDDLIVGLDDTADEVVWSLGDCGPACLDDLICGAWWYFVDNHGGQWSPEYRASCQLGRFYAAGPVARGPGTDGGQEVYAALGDYFG